MKLIIRTLHNLEEALVSELEALHCKEIKPLKRAVSCEASIEQMYQCNYLLRTAIKVMIPIVECTIYDAEDLYSEVYRVEWEKIFKINQTFSIDCVAHSDTFTHSQFCALKSKDAIADRFRDLVGKRPFVNPVNPDISIVIHIRQNILTILLDSTGDSLHMRGYRQYPVEAPLNEVLAAGMIILSGWDKKSTFLDPMCGSGTLLIEAAQIASNIPPQKESRKYCFMNWGEYDAKLWNKVISDAAARIDKKACPTLLGYDKTMKGVMATKTNAEEAGVLDLINVQRQDFFNADPMKNIIIITNPPYDKRLKEDDIIAFYKSIGDKFKKSFTDCVAWVIGGHITALKNLGLKTSKKINLLNGDIESGFYKYEMYEGEKKRN
jgi:putative N6-adenine-specific DNA methylase